MKRWTRYPFTLPLCLILERLVLLWVIHQLGFPSGGLQSNGYSPGLGEISNILKLLDSAGSFLYQTSLERHLDL